jgi:protein TonB
VDDFLAKARALFSVKRVQRSKPGARGQSSILESKTEAAPEQELAGDVAQVQLLPASQSELQAPSSSASGELPFAQAPVDAEPIRRTKLTDSLPVNPRSRHASQESAREFDLPGTLGILALCVILAVVCLGVGIAVGRKSSKPAPNASGSNSIAAAQSSASPMIGAQSLSTGNSASLQRSGASRHTDIRGQRPAAGRRSHSTPADSQEFGGDPQASTSGPGDDNPSAGTSASESEPASAAPSQISPAAGSSGAAQNPSSLSSVSPTVSSTVSPDSRVNASRTDEVTTPAKPPSERLVPAHVIYRVEPFYPRAALEQRVEGTVRIHATVGQDGRVRNLKVVSGPALLTSAALDAAQYWRYIPSLRNGEPIETEEEISIEFHFQH